MQKQVIKVTFFHAEADMSRYLSEKFFPNYRLEINNLECTDCDYWIIYGGLTLNREVVNVNPKNIFLITAEFEGGYSKTFCDQFEKVVTLDTKLKGNNLVYNHVGYPWFINKSFDELYSVEHVKKTKVLSVIASDYSKITYSRNYRIRFDFVMALKRHFGDKIDVFGRGFEPIEHKDKGLTDYKYSIAIENMPLPFNISEKIADCFLTHTFPFYYDCPNISRFYDDRSFVKLDIMDHDYSIKLIETVLKDESFYEERLKYVVASKKKYLLNYSFVATIVNVVKQYGDPTLIKTKTQIKADNILTNRLKLKLIDLIYNTLS